MFALAFFILLLTGFREFPPAFTSIVPQTDDLNLSAVEFVSDPFTDLITSFNNLITSFNKWDSQVGCDRFREKIGGGLGNRSSSSSLQLVGADSSGDCRALKLVHVAVLVKGWTWIPDNLDNLYSCSCGLSCLWTKSSVLADKPDALFFETSTPPRQVDSFNFHSLI